MKLKFIKYLTAILFIYSAQTFALNVDKMIIFTKKNQETAILKVTNPADYPVMFKVELGERNEKGNISPSITEENGKYYVVNNLDTVAFLNINACDTKFSEGVKCSGMEWVLAGKKKELNFSAFKQGSVKVNIRDSHERITKKQVIQL